MPVPLLFWVGAAALAALAFSQKSDGAPTPPPPEEEPDIPKPEGDVTENSFPEENVMPPRSDDFENFLADYARTDFHNAIENAERANNIPTNLYARQLWAESRYDPAAVSPAGAVGIAQFMPATADDLKIDPLNPAQAISAGARYLKWLYSITKDWRAALIAYNWGIGNVERYGVDQSPEESQNYADSILADSELA